jgi:uncharacterized sulfatase
LNENIMTDSPNILCFFVDQQRWDTCGCYGQPLPVTPQLDALAASGTRFENAFTCQPVCGPARAALQTGRYASEVACEVNHRRLPAKTPTLATYLNAAGYHTGYIGKWHLASTGPMGGPDDFRTKPVPPELRGDYSSWLASDVLEFTSHGYDGHMFDAAGNQRDFPEGRYRVDAQTDWVLEFLEDHHANRDEQPFFLITSYIEPHHQNDHHCYEGPHGSQERWQHFTPPGDLIGQGGDWAQEYPDYLGCINALDTNLGRVREKLSALGMADNTVVLYFSDHGSHFCTRNQEYKRSCHDGSIRIPLVASGPGFHGGHVRQELANLIDIPATILRSAGIEIPADYRGQPLQEAGDPKAPAWRTASFAEISESHDGRCLRSQRYTYEISKSDQAEHAWFEAFLYDNETDPHQHNNLVNEPVLTELRERFFKHISELMVANGEAEPILVSQTADATNT